MYTTEEALQWCLQIAEGLAYLHAQRPVIVHRDLKLENCLLTGAVDVAVSALLCAAQCVCISCTTGVLSPLQQRCGGPRIDCISSASTMLGDIDRHAQHREVAMRESALPASATPCIIACCCGADDGRGGLCAKVADFGLHAIVQATDADDTVKKL